MEFSKPKVNEVYPVGDSGLKPVPQFLDAVEITEREELYIYNAFDPGLSIRKVPARSVTYFALASGFILDSPDAIMKLGRGQENLEKRQTLASVSEVFWPVAAATFSRLLKVPKRDNGMNPSITPDMGLVISPPKRKIEGPKNTRRPAPPTSSGR